MLEYEKQRKLVILGVIGIILVIVISIIALINVWTPEKEKEKVFEVGNIDYSKLEEKNPLIDYYTKISKLLMEENLDELVLLVGEDYLKYYNYSSDDIKKYVEDKNPEGEVIEILGHKDDPGIDILSIIK